MVAASLNVYASDKWINVSGTYLLEEACTETNSKSGNGMVLPGPGTRLALDLGKELKIAQNGCESISLTFDHHGPMTVAYNDNDANTTVEADYNYVDFSFKKSDIPYNRYTVKVNIEKTNEGIIFTLNDFQFDLIFMNAGTKIHNKCALKLVK